MHRHPVNKNCSLPSRVVIFLIRGYQYLISPWLKPSCRFSPTCSQYGIEAFREHGVIRGGYLLIKRLCCCHPFHLGGHDPVPPSIKDKKDL